MLGEAPPYRRRGNRELGGVCGIAVAVAVFAGAGSYASARIFSDGFAAALIVSVALSFLGAIAARAIPKHEKPAENEPASDNAPEANKPPLAAHASPVREQCGRQFHGRPATASRPPPAPHAGTTSPLDPTTRGETMLPATVSREEWLTARKELLIREKQLTHARDDISQARRELPMVEVEENYTFDGPDGLRTLLDLFEGRRQLIVHHFMWVWDLDADGNETPQDTGCPSCSATADNIGNLAHLHARDTTLVAVSRAPYNKIAPFHARMGWTFPWYSSAGSSFNYDFYVTIDDRIAPVLLNFRDETELAETGNAWTPQRRGDYPGISTFLREGDTVFHTYTTMARGLEQPGGTHYYLDLTALGRQEEWEKPAGRVTEFGPSAGQPGVSFHDEYE